MSKIRNPGLSGDGRRSFRWAKAHMGALEAISERLERTRPLEGVRVGACLHVTKETAVLIDSLVRAGAQVTLAAANPLSTQDDVAAFLATVADVYAWRGETASEYEWCVRRVLGARPAQLIDDGGDLHAAAHVSAAVGVVGGSEETTTGVARLRALEAEGKLAYPVIAVNSARTKFFLDNKFGTGQSTIDGVLRSAELLLAGEHVVVVGYGWVGKRVAMRAMGMGSRVTVVEVDPVRAIEAHLDGFEVSDMDGAAETGDLFVTCTGQRNAVPYRAIERMRDGAVLANAGHFDVEIDVRSLFSKAKSVTPVRANLDEVTLPDGRKVFLVAKGRVANLVAADGSSPEVMQMSFANQLLATVRVHQEHESMQRRVYAVPEETDREIAEAALRSMGISIGRATAEQRRYAKSWKTLSASPRRRRRGLQRL